MHLCNENSPDKKYMYISVYFCHLKISAIYDIYIPQLGHTILWIAISVAKERCIAHVYKRIDWERYPQSWMRDSWAKYETTSLIDAMNLIIQWKGQLLQILEKECIIHEKSTRRTNHFKINMWWGKWRHINYSDTIDVETEDTDHISPWSLFAFRISNNRRIFFFSFKYLSFTE